MLLTGGVGVAVSFLPEVLYNPAHCVCVLAEVYDEKHVEGLMDKKPSKRKKKTPDGAAAMDRLYNPSIPVQPPKVVR